jgi:hypothetical protein
MYFVVIEMLLMKNISNIEVLSLEVQFCNFLTGTLHGISEALNLNSCWAVHSCIQNASDVHLCCFYPCTKFPKVSADTGILSPLFLSGWVEIQCGGLRPLNFAYAKALEIHRTLALTDWLWTFLLELENYHKVDTSGMDGGWQRNPSTCCSYQVPVITWSLYQLTF